MHETVPSHTLSSGSPWATTEPATRCTYIFSLWQPCFPLLETMATQKCSILSSFLSTFHFCFSMYLFCLYMGANKRVSVAVPWHVYGGQRVPWWNRPWSSHRIARILGIQLARRGSKHFYTVSHLYVPSFLLQYTVAMSLPKGILGSHDYLTLSSWSCLHWNEAEHLSSLCIYFWCCFKYFIFNTYRCFKKIWNIFKFLFYWPPCKNSWHAVYMITQSESSIIFLFMCKEVREVFWRPCAVGCWAECLSLKFNFIPAL